MHYAKPHLSYEQQLERLETRGLVVNDRQRAIQILQRVGYYRFSAYSYPMRVLLATGQPRESSRQFRSASFAEGATFDLAAELWQFDRVLRLLMLDVVESIEIALRVKVAYTLGLRGSFAHLSVQHLNETACVRASKDGEASVYDVWLAKHQAAVLGARAEDFITHYVQKYDGEVPIWVATEVMDLGSLSRLFGLLKQSDQTVIARELRVDSGRALEKWLKCVNYVRNVSAHHARLWNRIMTYSVGKFPAGLAPQLGHLGLLSSRDREKLYAIAAIAAHLVRAINSDSTWPARFVSHLSTFPMNEFVSPDSDMGFPTNWATHEVWSAA